MSTGHWAPQILQLVQLSRCPVPRVACGDARNRGSRAGGQGLGKGEERGGQGRAKTGALRLAASLPLLSGRPPSCPAPPGAPPAPEEQGGLGISPVEKKQPHIFRDVLNIVLATQRPLRGPSP